MLQQRCMPSLAKPRHDGSTSPTGLLVFEDCPRPACSPCQITPPQCKEKKALSHLTAERSRPAVCSRKQHSIQSGRLADPWPRLHDSGACCLVNVSQVVHTLRLEALRPATETYLKQQQTQTGLYVDGCCTPDP